MATVNNLRILQGMHLSSDQPFIHSTKVGYLPSAQGTTSINQEINIEEFYFSNAITCYRLEEYVYAFYFLDAIAKEILKEV